MNYFPVYYKTFVTNLSTSEITEKLSDKITLNQSNFPKRKSKEHFKEYQGQIINNLFRISRTLEGRNSFQPEIKGIIKPSGNKTKVHVMMKLNNFTNIFMHIWLGITLIASIATILTMVRTNQFSNIFSYIPIIMFIAGYIGMFKVFNSEVSKSKKFLDTLLECKFSSNY